MTVPNDNMKVKLTFVAEAADSIKYLYPLPLLSTSLKYLYPLPLFLKNGNTMKVLMTFVAEAGATDHALRIKQSKKLIGKEGEAFFNAARALLLSRFVQPHGPTSEFTVVNEVVNGAWPYLQFKVSPFRPAVVKEVIAQGSQFLYLLSGKKLTWKATNKSNMQRIIAGSPMLQPAIKLLRKKSSHIEVSMSENRKYINLEAIPNTSGLIVRVPLEKGGDWKIVTVDNGKETVDRTKYSAKTVLTAIPEAFGIFEEAPASTDGSNLLEARAIQTSLAKAFRTRTDKFPIEASSLVKGGNMVSFSYYDPAVEEDSLEIFAEKYDSDNKWHLIVDVSGDIEVGHLTMTKITDSAVAKLAAKLQKRFPDLAKKAMKNA